MLKYISYTLVQSFSQVDPFLLLDLFENLDISGHFFLITVVIFHYVGRKLPYFIDIEMILVTFFYISIVLIELSCGQAVKKVKNLKGHGKLEFEATPM